MFNSDADVSGPAYGGASASSSCAASDLKTILNSIADQIAAADLRHTQSLHEMQQRLDLIRAETGHVREHAPAPVAQAYDRVDQRIQDLAARLTAGGSVREERHAPAAPAALASAAPGGTGLFATRADTHHDAFDLVGDQSEQSDGPWDRQAAEALVGVYTPQLADGSVDKVAVASPVLIQIEDRFAEVASKIEQYVRDLRPIEDHQHLDERFALLEERLGSMLSQAAAPAAAESLQSLELQIDDMARQIESAQSHFSRLDTIEHEIRSLAGRVSEDRLAEVFRSTMPPQPDVADLAGMIANHMSSSLGRAGHSGSSEQIDELRGLLQTLAEDQRHGDEQTATILDTMQQAMIRLLDRMDAIETGVMSSDSGLGVSDRADPSLQVDRLAAAFEAGSQAPMHYAPGPASRGSAPAPDQITAAVQAHQVAQQQQQQQQQQAPQPRPTAAAQRPAPAEPASPEPTDPVARARKNLIDSARRAREAASEGAAPDAMRLRIDASVGAAERAVKPKAEASTSRISPLSMALVALIALGAGFTAMSYFQGRTAPVTAQTAAPVAPARDVEPKRSAAESGLEKDTSLDAQQPYQQRRVGFDQGQQDFGQVIDPVEQQAPQQPAYATPLPSPAPAGNAPFTTAALTSNIPGGSGRVVSAPSLTEAAMPPVTVGPNSLRLAAAQGDASAQFEVASRLAEGKGTPQDLAAAIVWYEKSASQGFVLAQYRLGTHYERGLGVKADVDQAIDWYRKAADQGNVKSMYNLAVLSTARQNPGPDYAGAVTWFSAAAGYGLVDSQFNLAVLYDSGVGVTRDAKAAYKWFSIAAAAGDADSAKRRDALKSKLSKDQLRQAEAEIAVWRPLAPEAVGNDPRVAGSLWQRRAGGQTTAN